MAADAVQGPLAGTDLERELLAMADRLSDLRDQGTASADELVAELETAMEELRVTAEEIAAQQRQITELLRQSRQTQASVRWIVEAVPTPVLTTDEQGAVLHANAAAARLLGLAANRVTGKPLQAFIDVADRRTVRAMVAAAVDGDAPEPATVRLTPRGGRLHEARLVAVPASELLEPRVRVRWFLDATQANDSTAALALLGSFAELVALPTVEPTPDAVARRILDVARRAVPEVDDVTVTLGDPRKPDVLTSTSTFAQQADAAQVEAAEGPCAEAFLTDQVVSSDDLRHDARWPHLARRVRQVEVNAAIGVPLRADDGVLGVLNLYGRSGVHFDEPGLRARADLFGRAAAALLQESRRMQLLQDEAYHLRQALVTRPEIDQAKGILMARFGYSADDAFRHLVAVSQRRNVKLREIAREVVAMVNRADPGRAGPQV